MSKLEPAGGMGRLVEGEPPARRGGTELHWASFTAVAVQFGLIVVLVSFFQLESRSLARLLQLAFLGFLIHHFLPLRYRLPFFAVLSMGSVLLVQGAWGSLLRGTMPLGTFLVGLIPGGVLLGMGLVLIGVCHLPVRFSVRVGLVLVLGIVAALFRANAHWVPQLEKIWVILGSMFVFRLMIYLYDLRHRAAPFSPARSISYFFMLPNVCFPLYPVVDYKTFCATYYNEDWRRIYQTGVVWMLRGIFHLLLYRLVYHYAPLNILTSATDVAGFIVGTYLLYLRISGQFHLIVGLLHMFGFNLPETHHLYLLASSFTDFWRRINIYWKDFIMKLFFYPAFFRMRKLGTTRALALATILTFFATWLLHSWQWFWIRGEFLISWQDISFWTVLAVLVLVNALYEAKKVRPRTLSAARITMNQRIQVGLKTMGTFLVISLLWTMWSCQSFEELQLLADLASRPTLVDLVVVLAGLLVVGVAGMIWGHSSRETSEGRRSPAQVKPFLFWRSATAVCAVSAGLFAIPLLSLLNHSQLRSIPLALRSDKMNARDMDNQGRGYYEELDRERANLHAAWRPDGAPVDWQKDRSRIYRNRQDFLINEFNPSTSGIIAGERLTINSLGLRDREYSKEKPEGVYRILLVGASHEMGTGVKDDETFENILEDHLNVTKPTNSEFSYEILNLSVGGNGLFQKLLRLEAVGFQLQPDLVLLTMYAPDRVFILPKLSNALRQGYELPPGFREFLSRIYEEAGVTAKTPDLVIQSRLRKYIPEMYAWVLNRFVEQCEMRGIEPLVIYRPQPHEQLHPPEFVEIAQIAETVGVDLLDLSGAFKSVKDRNDLILAKWDDHTNARGHQLLAEALIKDFMPLLLADGQYHHRVMQAKAPADHYQTTSSTEYREEAYESSGDTRHN